jgi:alanyl-tRNA synthetase
LIFAIPASRHANTKEVAYDIAGRITKQYREFSRTKGIEFSQNTSVRPFDSSTLFTSAGMQQYKPLFSDPTHIGTTSNTQSCLRLGDLDEIGDGTHSLYFEMLGLFSFRQWSVSDGIEFWLEFLDGIGGYPDHVTIHPDKLEEWCPLYKGRLPIKVDPDCTWSDGNVQGYCTEFYKQGVEIGNIVNPLGTCIDIGFGLERLDLVINGTVPKTPEVILEETIMKIIESGYRPGNKEQGYVLRKLLRLLWSCGGKLDHLFFEQEVERQQRLRLLYDRLKPKHSDRPPEWWFDTHGIVLSDMVD